MFRDKDYVYAVYQERSFSKAAARLYISQPSLSAKIKKIECELGAMIFDRSTSPLRLTEFGEKYIEAITEVNSIEHRIENLVNDINMLQYGELSVGASNVYTAYVLPPIIAAYREKFPGVNIRLVEGNTDTLEEMLSKNEIDIVMDNNHYDTELYEKVEYTNEKILLAVPNGFEVCSKIEKYAISEECIKNRDYLSDSFPPLPLGELCNVPFVLLTPGNDTRTRGERMCRDAGFRPKIALEVNQQATAYMISTTGLGAVFVSDMVVRAMPLHSSLNYYKLESPFANRSVSFTLKKHKNRTRTMDELMRIIVSD